MFSYPYISLPHSITENVDPKSYISEIDDNPPKEPTKPTRQKTYEGCLIGLVFYVISAIVFSGIVSLSISLPIGVVITIGLWIVFSATSQVEHSKRLKTYETDYAKYLADVRRYNQDKAEAEKELDNSISYGDDTWKFELIKKRLANYKFKLTQGYGKRGASEEFFTEQLKKFFDCEVYRNPPINCKNGHTFNPDLALFFDNENLAIAIEIDEPYTLKNGTPIHYYNNEDGIPFFSDEEVFSPYSRKVFSSRTHEITSEGYIQIKFAEEQVVLQPDSCCKYVADRIKSRIGFELSNINLDNIEQLKRVPSWTYEEAKDMYRKGYRERYLQKIRSKSDYKNYDADELPF